MFIRNVAGVVSTAATAYAIVFLPITLFQVVYNTTPFWASFLSIFILREGMKPLEIAAMLVSFSIIVMLAFERQLGPHEAA